MKCGEINSTKILSKDKHSCTSGLDKLSFPYLVTTSWLKLRGFFLSEIYDDILQRLGVEIAPSRKVPIRTPVETEVEEIIEEAVEARETI